MRDDRGAGRARAPGGADGLPRPPDFRDEVLPNGFHLTWPPYLAVVDGLVRCFGRPYREAYGLPECREPPEPQRTSR